MFGFFRGRHGRLLAAIALMLTLAASIAVTGCVGSAQRASSSTPVAEVVGPSATPTPNGPNKAVLSEAKGMTLAQAREMLESNGWKVKAKGTKGRSIGKPDEKKWQVIKVTAGKKATVTLTAGRLTTRTERISFKTEKVKLAYEPTTYREVVREGVNGKRKITYLDGKKIKTKVVKKPVSKILEVGTQHVYTGRCTIWGSYANRYVKCTGDYNPSAKAAAGELAALCNSTTWPIAECKGVYGTYFR